MSSSFSFDPQLEAMSRADLERYQWQKLVKQLEFLEATNNFYREKWSREHLSVGSLTSFSEFAEQVPVTRKAELIEDQAENPPFGNRLGVELGKLVQVNLTGGTSGKGQEIHGLTLSDVASTAAMYSWGCYWAGLRPGDAIANTIPVSLAAAGQWLHASFSQQRLLQLPIGVYDARQKLDFALKFGAKAVVATPSYLTTLRQVASESRVDLRSSSIGVLLTATEAYSPDWAKRTEEAWGARLFEWYGATQRVVAWNCEVGALNEKGSHGVLHSFPHLVILEVIDPETGSHVAPGDEGEVVVTFLESEASPLVRFATGDRARFMGWDCCSCGRSFPGIESGTIGRYDDMLKVKGVNLWPASVDSVVLAHPLVVDYRGRVFTDSEHREQIELHIRFQQPSPETTIDRTVRELQEKLRHQVGLRFEIVAAAELADEFRDERTKARRWRDERIVRA